MLIRPTLEVLLRPLVLTLGRPTHVPRVHLPRDEAWCCECGDTEKVRLPSVQAACSSEVRHGLKSEPDREEGDAESGFGRLTREVLADAF